MAALTFTNLSSAAPELAAASLRLASSTVLDAESCSFLINVTKGSQVDSHMVHVSAKKLSQQRRSLNQARAAPPNNSQELGGCLARLQL